jgi:hypothetical protein
MFHQVGNTVGDGVELVLGRLVLPCLAVLEQRNHEEGDDRVVVLISNWYVASRNLLNDPVATTTTAP